MQLDKDTVRHLAAIARVWPFGVDDHYWQRHEKVDFSNWLLEQIGEVNADEYYKWPTK